MFTFKLYFYDAQLSSDKNPCWGQEPYSCRLWSYDLLDHKIQNAHINELQLLKKTYTMVITLDSLAWLSTEIIF